MAEKSKPLKILANPGDWRKAPTKKNTSKKAEPKQDHPGAGAIEGNETEKQATEVAESKTQEAKKSKDATAPQLPIKVKDKVVLEGDLPKAHPTQGTVYTVHAQWYKNAGIHYFEDKDRGGGRIVKAVLWEDDSRKEHVVEDGIGKIVLAPRWFNLRREEVAYRKTVDIDPEGSSYQKVVGEFCAIWWDKVQDDARALVRFEDENTREILDGCNAGVGHWVLRPDAVHVVEEGPQPRLGPKQ